MIITSRDNSLEIQFEDATAEHILYVANSLRDEGMRKSAIEKGLIKPCKADPAAIVAWEVYKSANGIKIWGELV